MAGRIMSMRNSNDTIGNRNRDLPAYSAVPQPAAPPGTPLLRELKNKMNIRKSKQQEDYEKCVTTNS